MGRPRNEKAGFFVKESVKQRPRIRRVVAPVALVAVLAVGFLAGRQSGPAHEPRFQLPLIVERVQGMGELHTVSHSYQNVMDYSTAREPSDLARMLPGGSQVVSNLTRNEGMLAVHGKVEAGVDLRQATARMEGKTLVLSLPEPTVYPAQVKVFVHDHKGGLMWRDHNFALKAQQSAGERFEQASRAKGILDQAKSEATKTLKSLLQSSWDGDIRVEFQPSFQG